MIRAQCVHPGGTFLPFLQDEVEQAIATRFEQQVRREPDRLALQGQHHTTSYAALNAMANRLAHAILAACGEGPEPIALLLPQGVTAIAALLGVLKAGKCYVPLDPAAPRAHLATLLTDVQTRLILADTATVAVAVAVAAPAIQVLNCDALPDHLCEQNPGLEVEPDSPAYILYTSGSTGTPKGVVDNHRNVLHHIMQVTNDLHVCAADRQTLLRFYGFIGAVRDIFSALLNGASLHLCSLDEVGVSALTHWLIQEEITIYRSVTSVFRQFVGTLNGAKRFPHLRLIHVGGEPVARRDVELYQQYFAPTCIFVNILALTEIGLVRHYFINTQTQMTDSLVPVGYATGGVDVHVLDDSGDAVEPGSVGEIVVCSRYLAVGYWRRPDLTRVAFLPAPQGGDTRLYYTGDLGRMEPDGCLLHMGRKDLQVKINGRRVDTTAVEATLFALGTIKEAVVLLHEEAATAPRLVAYIVPAAQQTLTVSGLRRALAETLPDFMVPAVFVFLDTVPRTLHGKVDRRALPEPPRTRPVLESAFVAPRTPLETALGHIWAEVLHVALVGVDDPFLDLGGNSLLAMQIVTRVRHTFEIELSIQALLEAATVAALARRLIEQQLAQLAPDGLDALLTEAEGSTPQDSYSS